MLLPRAIRPVAHWLSVGGWLLVCALGTSLPLAGCIDEPPPPWRGGGGRGGTGAGAIGGRPSGRGGSAGHGPVGGAAGGGSVGGAGGGAVGGAGEDASLPSCVGAAGPSIVFLLDGDGKPFDASFHADVTVASIATCSGSSCTWKTEPWQAEGATELTLTGQGDARYTLLVGLPGFSGAALSVGDELSLDLTVTFPATAFRTRNQSVLLKKGTDIVLLAFAGGAWGSVAFPSWQTLGIETSDGGLACDGGVVFSVCQSYRRSVTFSVGGETRALAPGETATLGGLRFANGWGPHYYGPACDAMSRTLVGAYRPPTTARSEP